MKDPFNLHGIRKAFKLTLIPLKPMLHFYVSNVIEQRV